MTKTAADFFAPVRVWAGNPAQRPRMLAAISGLLIALAQPPFGFLPGLVGYGLLLYALERDLGRWPKRTAFFMGWLAGFAYFFVSCFWVAEAFLVDAATYGWMAPFAATLLPTGIGLFWGAFAVAYIKLKPLGQKRFLAFAALFSVFEMARGMVLSGFPWNPAGSTWKAGGAISQIAAYVGVYGLGFVTVTVFASLGVTRRKAYGPLIWSVLVLAACFGLGEYRLATTPVKNTATLVRYVQPAIGQAAKWTDGEFDKLFMSYVRMSRSAPAPGHRAPDIIIWPEGALPMTWEDVSADDTWTAPVLADVLRDNQTLLIGTSRQTVGGNGKRVWHNSLLAMQRHDGKSYVTATYDKFKLVPFGEFTPFQDILNPLGMSALTHFDDSFTPGKRTAPMSVPGLPRFLPLICYEGIFPSLDQTNYGPKYGNIRPRWIVNVSNDAWFGPTTGPLQHLNLASYRAIEEGLPMVRSTPTGISVIVDPLGRVVSGTRLNTGQRGVIDAFLPDRIETTHFARERNRIVAFLSFFCLLIVGFDPCVVWLRKLVGKNN